MLALSLLTCSGSGMHRVMRSIRNVGGIGIGIDGGKHDILGGDILHFGH